MQSNNKILKVFTNLFVQYYTQNLLQHFIEISLVCLIILFPIM